MRKNVLKVLGTIYMATDCSNGVYDYAILHWTQARIVGSVPDLVCWIDGVVPVDGDGFARVCTEGRGYRLTEKGYEALTEYDAARYPPERRRFYMSTTDKETP